MPALIIHTLFARSAAATCWRGDLTPLVVCLSKHVDFRLLADEVDTVLPRRSRAKAGPSPYPVS